MEESLPTTYPPTILDFNWPFAGTTNPDKKCCSPDLNPCVSAVVQVKVNTDSNADVLKSSTETSTAILSPTSPRPSAYFVCREFQNWDFAKKQARAPDGTPFPLFSLNCSTYSAEAHFTVEDPGGAGGLENAGQREGDPTWGRRRSRASSPPARRAIFAATRKLTRGP